jgi:hypothetical protein
MCGVRQVRGKRDIRSGIRLFALLQKNFDEVTLNLSLALARNVPQRWKREGTS